MQWLMIILMVSQMGVKDAVLKRRPLPVPINPTVRIEGLKRFQSQDPRLLEALKRLEAKGEWPYSMGWTRQTDITSPPMGTDRGLVGWRERGGDVIGLNAQEPVIKQSFTEPKLSTFLESALVHENRHVEGDDEIGALKYQKSFVDKDSTEVGKLLQDILASQILLRGSKAEK